MERSEMNFDTSTANTKFYEVGEVAARLRCSKPHAYTLIRQRQLGSYRFGGRVCVSEAQLGRSLPIFSKRLNSDRRERLNRCYRYQNTNEANRARTAPYDATQRRMRRRFTEKAKGSHG